jgi:cobalt-precorrin 5A hydrolase
MGCRENCGADELIALLSEAIVSVGEVGALAAPSHRADLASVQAAALHFGLPVLAVGAAQLVAAQAHCRTFSALVHRRMGVGSVAEAAALAGAGAGSRLVLSRIQSARATCAVAVGP